jgi:hypothetical protein
MKYNAEQVAFMLAEAIDQNREYKSWHCSTQHLMALVERVVAEEREACAMICEARARDDRVSNHRRVDAALLAERIRARGQA